MKQKIYHYHGEKIEVTYDLMRCIHAAECVRGLPQVFDTRKRPWVEPSHGSADQIARVIMRCPTGSLHFERTDGGDNEPVPEENTITLIPDGPLYLRGEIEIIEPAGTFKDTRVALCRCGQSKNKPLCDNSHLRIGFKAEGALANKKSGLEVWSTGDTLRVEPIPNGPLRIQGNFEIRSLDSRSIFRGKRARLCRCGGSGNKPFCDGTHTEIGFTSEE